LQQLTERRRS